MKQEEQSSVWLHSDEDKLRSLIADEAKAMPMLDAMQSTIKQLKAKQQFRLALLNQLLDDVIDKE
jgi:adenine C2-methylase RlmN of 23S rRNA A2503 and tRNA A37